MLKGFILTYQKKKNHHSSLLANMSHHKPVVIQEQVKATAAKIMNSTFHLFKEEFLVLFFFHELLSLSIKFPQVWMSVCSLTFWITPDLDAAWHSCMFFNTASARELQRDTLISCSDSSSVATPRRIQNTFPFLTTDKYSMFLKEINHTLNVLL